MEPIINLFLILVAFSIGFLSAKCLDNSDDSDDDDNIGGGGFAV